MTCSGNISSIVYPFIEQFIAIHQLALCVHHHDPVTIAIKGNAQIRLQQLYILL